MELHRPITRDIFAHLWFYLKLMIDSRSANADTRDYIRYHQNNHKLGWPDVIKLLGVFESVLEPGHAVSFEHEFSDVLPVGRLVIVSQQR